MEEFVAQDWYEIAGRGRVAVVLNPREWKRKDCPFIGTEVMIDGECYRVKAVESFLLPVIRDGAPIGLLVERCPT